MRADLGLTSHSLLVQDQHKTIGISSTVSLARYIGTILLVSAGPIGARLDKGLFVRFGGGRKWRPLGFKSIGDSSFCLQ
jgi:hypothetical protein